MDITQEFIDGLAINEVTVMRKIAEGLGIKLQQVSATVGLLNEGCTVPFISRYRKEATGSLDEVQVRDISHEWTSLCNLEARRIEILKAVFAQGKLTPELYDVIARSGTLAELEDIYAPYKKKKKTRGMIAEEKGLGPLADFMRQSASVDEILRKASDFVKEDAEHPELSVPSIQDAVTGAQDILAERMAQDPDNRARIKAFYLKSGKIVVKGVGDEEKAKTSVYKMYWDFSEPLSQVKPHRVLAINRGERAGELEVKLEADEEAAANLIVSALAPANKLHEEAIRDGLSRLLSPAVLRELRSDSAEAADSHGIEVFSENLRNLLMQPPIKGTRVLGIDPGIRTGTKCAALDETGKFLGYFVIKQDQKEASKKAILDAVTKHSLSLIAVGNGTGSDEVRAIVAELIEEKALPCFFTVVDEDGASVYSASDIAREEFPDLDLTIRGAISIGRRLQDPLAELVKIDPKSIGVGLYQHDVNQKRLSESLDEVVGSVVNRVGVNLNTASHAILKYVSGINASLAKKIVKYRDEHGKILSREELLKVPGMGPKSYEQCAGFLKIPESPNPLDNTWVHPENYALAAELVAAGGSTSAEQRKALMEKYGVGETTLRDIAEELEKPSRDPREDFPKPLLEKGSIKFEDLAEGQILKGKVKNVVDFGAFVDLGMKETALLHVSEMADRFVSDPMEVLKVGDIREFRIIGLDHDRRRISLSLRTPGADRGGQGGSRKAEGGHSVDSGDRAARKVVAVRRSDQAPPRENRKPQAFRPSQNGKEDDGMTYNPFAELLKKGRK